MTLDADRYPRTDDEVAAFVIGLGVPGIIDVHTHLMPPRLQQAVWRYFDQLDDPAWPITYRHGPDELVAQLAGLGVVGHTALAYAHKEGMAATLNDYTLGLAERHAQIIATFTFHAEETAAQDVADALARGGTMAKIHLQVGKFDTLDPRLTAAWTQLEQRAVPVVIHAGAVYGVDGGEEFCGVDPIARLLDAHPDLVLVVAHLGAPDFGDFLRFAERTPGLYLDTAMNLTEPPFLGAFPSEGLERLAGIADRLLFGSDFPTIPHDFVAQVTGLAQLELDEQALRGLLHDNAAALLSRVRDTAI